MSGKYQRKTMKIIAGQLICEVMKFHSQKNLLDMIELWWFMLLHHRLLRYLQKLRVDYCKNHRQVVWHFLRKFSWSWQWQLLKNLETRNKLTYLSAKLGGDKKKKKQTISPKNNVLIIKWLQRAISYNTLIFLFGFHIG